MHIEIRNSPFFSLLGVRVNLISMLKALVTGIETFLALSCLGSISVIVPSETESL